MQDLGHPERDTFTAANLVMIDAAIQAGVSPLTAAQIIVGNALNVAVGVAMSGDISIDNAGVTTIGADKVANSMLENMTRGTVKVGGVADAPTDLQAKAEAQILIGDATDLKSVEVTGDVTITKAGVTAIEAGKVANAQLEDIAQGSIKVGGALDAPTDLIAKGNAKLLLGDATDLNSVSMSGDVTIDNLGETTIGVDKVANTMLENMTRGTVKVGGVADAPTDLDAKGDAQILIGDATDVKSVAVTGDVTIDNLGETSIGADKITNTELANIAQGSIKVGGAADAPTDLVAKGDGKILIGDATDLASVTMSGDVTIINTGETSIGADKVTKVEIAADVAGDGLVQAVGGELDVNVDDSTVELNTDKVRIKDLGVTIAKLEAALLKGIATLDMSFEQDEETVTKVYFPMKVTINKIRSIVMKAIAATNDGTITGANSVGASNNGIVTVAASSALNAEDTATPDSNKEVAAGSYYQLTTAKAAKGGKVLVTLEYTRTA
jgi:archaellum component FlaF (FlaF/FlaG flagellin family)